MPELTTETEHKHLVIGAGPVGLAMAKALKDKGIPYDHVDAAAALGGNWHHGVYATAHIISSRKTTEFADYPMPADYPDFPSADQMAAYLTDYARTFDLERNIRFGAKVIFLRPVAGNRWEATLEGGETLTYKGAIVCNGHHWDRRWPDYPGRFAGEFIHPKDYKDPEQLRGRRVLVIGGGNSACDVASEAGRLAAKAHLSTRRGYWILPKTMFGRPTAELSLLRYLPETAQRLALRGLLKVVIGRYEDYGLPHPDHRIFERHPTVNSELLHYLKHGRVTPKPDVDRFDGSTVHFVDGSSDDYDLVVCATGFHVSYPFLPEGLVDIKGAVPQVYGGAMLPGYRNLYLFGWAQPRYGFGPLVTPAASLLADMIELQDSCANGLGDLMQAAGQRPPETHLMNPIRTLRLIRRGKRRLPLIKHLDRRLTKRRAAEDNAVIEPPADLLTRNAALQVN